MKLLDYVKESICQYPTLFLFSTFEASYLRVLDQTFGTLGNGLTWAKTKDPKKGGYLCIEDGRVVKGEWKRKFDKNYGIEKCNFNLETFLKNQIVVVSTLKGEKLHEFVGTIDEFNRHEKKIYWEKNLFEVWNGSVSLSEMYWINNNVVKNNEKHSWAPYPYFEKEYSSLWKEESKYIQEDWKHGALYWLLECEKFFNNQERVKLYSYYPTAENIKELERWILQDIEADKYGKTNVNEKINKAYKTMCFSGDNFEEFANEKWDNDLKRIFKFIEETKFKLLR